MRAIIILLVLAVFSSCSLLAQAAAAIHLPRTGQTVSYGAGDDGAIQKGLVWPVPRFSDNGDGTVSDNLTGLLWLKNANCFGSQTWSAALTSANTLAGGACGLTDGSAAGDWRVPSAEQLASLTDLSRTNPALPAGHPFSGVQSNVYWSAATSVGSPANAWYVNFSDGSISYTGKGGSYPVWPVRAGQFLTLDSLAVAIKGSPYFGALAPGGTAVTREVALRNQGVADLAVTSVAMTGTNPADFSVATGGASPCGSLAPTLAAGGNCTLTVTFTPTYGAKHADLTVSASSKSISLPLSGTTLPPDTTITDKPASNSNSATPGFSFTSTAASSTFECRLDSGTFAACTNPISYSGLADGSHTFSVRAVDPGLNTDPTPASWTWTQDTTAPDTTIDNKPAALTNSTAASFAFLSNDGTATFQCSLDGAGYTACTTPQNYTGLAEGSHTFTARAVDPVGNPDPIPAAWTWTVDSIPPDTTIESKPINPTNSTAATFIFTATESGSTFACRLDSESFAACSTPISYSGLTEGSHSFEVRAGDLAGNIDPTPANFNWTIDTLAPSVTSFTLPATASSLNVSISSFTATDSVGVTGYFLSENATPPAPNDAGWSATPPAVFNFATEGIKTLYAFAKDGAGNISQPVTASVTISIPRTLTVTKNGTGTGTVTSSPAGINCAATCSGSFTAGSQVTLTATTDSGFTFGGWSGEGCSGTGTCSVTMDADRNVTATFVQDTHILTLNLAGSGTGTVSASPAGASGTPHNGTLINSPTWTAGHYGNALSLSNT